MLVQQGGPIVLMRISNDRNIQTCPYLSKDRFRLYAWITMRVSSCLVLPIRKQQIMQNIYGKSSQ